MKKLIVLSCALVAAGCVTKPHNVVPEEVEARAYSKYTCDQMVLEHSRLVKELIEASRMQWATRTALKVSPSGHKRTKYIARLKGQIIALEENAIVSRCYSLIPVSLVDVTKRAK